MSPIPLITPIPHTLPDYARHPALAVSSTPPASGLYLAAEKQGIVLHRFHRRRGAT